MQDILKSGMEGVTEDQLRREIRRRDMRFFLRGSLFVLAAVSVLVSPLCWPHARAIGRIGLIQLAPLWDWSDYYHRDCLLHLDDYAAESTPDDAHQPLHCSFCEDLEAIDVLSSNITMRYIMDQYVTHDLPVIVKDAAVDWPITTLDGIIQAYRNDDSGWGVCNWMGNTRPFDDLEDFFRLLQRFPPQKPWVAHWENCARKSVKTGRRFYQRPEFITAAVDLSFNNWVLLSGNHYRAQRFKQIKMLAGLAMMGQIRGSNIIRLYPECRPSCPSVQLALFAGDIALFNPRRWSLEYQPDEEEELNMAVIVQGEID